jgi:hypothetical protein
MGSLSSVSHFKFGLRDAWKAVLKPPQSRRWRDHQVSPHRAKRLDCGAFTAAFPLVVHPKMIPECRSRLAAAFFLAYHFINRHG